MPFLLVLGLASFASAFSMRAADPLLVLVADDLGVTVARAALLASAFTLPYAATQLIFGPIGDSIGKVRLMRINLVCLTLALAGSAFASDFDSLMVLRVVSGGFAGGVIPVAFGVVGDRVAFDRRPVALSRVVLAVVLGQLSGSVLSGLIGSAVGWRFVFWACAAVAAVGAAAATFGIRETQAREPLSLSTSLVRYKGVLRNPLAWRVFAVAATEGAASLGIFPVVAPLMEEHGLGGAVEAGLALGAFGIGGAFYTFAVARLVALLGLGGMAATGAAAIGAAFLAIAAGPPLVLTYALFAFAGFTFYMIHNVLQILATELAPEARGSGLALYASCFFAGQAGGSALASPALDLFGASEVFAGGGVVLILLAWPAYWMPPRTAKVTSVS